MSIERHLRALLDLVESDRVRQRDAILEAARLQAAALVRQAHAQARARVHDALQEARERQQQALAAANARRQTRERLARQAREGSWLAQAQDALPQTLLRRWNQAAGRRDWLDSTLARARIALGGAAWTLRHAPGLNDDDLAALRTQTPTGSRIERDPTLTAGLRIGSGDNVLDATLAGLLADRDAVASSLLRHLESAP